MNDAYRLQGVFMSKNMPKFLPEQIHNSNNNIIIYYIVSAVPCSVDLP